VGEKRDERSAISLFSVLSHLSLFVCLVSPAVGQVPAARPAPLIVLITLDNQNVFDSADHSFAARVQNALHVRTRAPLIRREFLFHEGERYDSARVAETERNLRYLGTFKSVRIDTISREGGVEVHVTTHEVVTAQLQFAFKGSGSSFSWRVSPVENNLLGTLTHAELGYQHDPDRTTTSVILSRRRLINDKIGASTVWFHRSDGTGVSAQLAQPYFEAASKSSGALTFDDRRVRVLQFRYGNVDTASSILQDRYLRARADYSRAIVASPRGYVRVGGIAQIRRDDYTTDSLYKLNGFSTNSVTGALGVYVEASRINKPKVFAFQSLSSEEDVDLSTTLTLSLFAAPSSFGYEAGHSGLAPGISLHTGFQFPHGFVFGDGYASGMYTSVGLDSGSLGVSGTAVWMPHPRHQLLVHGEANALKNPLPGTEFDLGLGAGPRAFKQHSFTGDREFFLTGEYRFMLGRDVLKVGDLGLAVFGDYGGAWWSTDATRSGWDAGVGLRAAFGHALVATNRFDLAWHGEQPGLPAGWRLSLGSGLLFSTSTRGSR
jgi:hypothetical protein